MKKIKHLLIKPIKIIIAIILFPAILIILLFLDNLEDIEHDSNLPIL